MKKIKSLYHFLSPKFQTVHLEYRVNPKPRLSSGNQTCSALYEIINENRALYEENLAEFLQYKERFWEIKDSKDEKDENKIAWNNQYLPGLDIVGIYGMLAKYKPSRYIEIGSGNSTKVARKSVSENGLHTEIVSIDPFPRANIDHLADKVVREPFENMTDNRFIVESLAENDILFIDNSHRVFPNSDATVCFLELLPFLKKGVVVHFHDIYLPYDYPQDMCDRFYSEQYMLAAFLLANPERYRPILPNFFVSQDQELSKTISPVWEHPNMENVERHGGSFWLQIG